MGIVRPKLWNTLIIYSQIPNYKGDILWENKLTTKACGKNMLLPTFVLIQQFTYVHFYLMAVNTNNFYSF